MRIVHISTVHKALDVRIFYKECRTLAAAGYDVHLVISDPPAKERDGVFFHAVDGAAGAGRWRRVLKRSTTTYRQAVALRAKIYHFHDPQLIPVGILLKLANANVIYDVHEDFPRQVLSQGNDHPIRSRFKSLVWILLEACARVVLDAFVCATPTIARKFPKHKTVTVHNFPLLEEFHLQLAHTRSAYRDRPNNILYVGGISVTRGIREIVRAIAMLPETLAAKLVLVGAFGRPELKAELEQMPGWNRVEFLSWQPRDTMVRKLSEGRLGLILFHPEPNHIEALPNKLFEYMAAGLPVIASDFPLWRGIVEGVGCGLLVDPLDPRAIAEAIQYLLEHPGEADEMGRRGREAVQSRYNWDAEANKLLGLYRTMENG